MCDYDQFWSLAGRVAQSAEAMPNFSFCYVTSRKNQLFCAPIMYIYIIYIISEETSIFAPQRLRFYRAPGVAACTVGKVRASTVFICVCSMFRPSDFLLFVKNGFVVGVRWQGTASHLLMGRPRHCLSATHGWPSLNNSQCSSPTLYTHTVYIELHGRRQAGSEGQGRSAGE